MASLETVATFCLVISQLQKHLKIILRGVPENGFHVYCPNDIFNFGERGGASI